MRLSVLLAAAFPLSIRAQDTAKKASSKGADKAAAKAAEKPAAKGTEKAATKSAGDEAAPEAGADSPNKTGSVEVFTDPNAEAAMKKFHSVPGWKPCRLQDVAAVKAMAAAGGTVDRDLIARFVQGMGYDLASRSNINALVNPPPNLSPNSARGVQNASDNLIEVLNTAKQAGNTSFLSVYNQELVNALPKLLDNHLIARIQAMIVLGQTGSAAALPVFVSQLKDKSQTVWVQLWAARGLTNVFDNGRRVDTVGAQEAINAGKVVADYLESKKDLPWPAQMRALQALGAMRQAAVPSNMQKAEMAVAAMRLLANPDGRPEVRAAAAWALGMFRVSPQITRYNFPLIAYEIGQLTADVGEQVNSSFGENPTRSHYLTNLLVTPIFQSFYGVEGVRESGLLKSPTAAPSQGFITKVADLTSKVARASVELVRAPGGQVSIRKRELGDRVSALKSFLDKNAPKDFHLVPGVPPFRAGNAQVADAPVRKPRVAGAPGGQ